MAMADGIVVLEDGLDNRSGVLLGNSTTGRVLPSSRALAAHRRWTSFRGRVQWSATLRS